MITESVLRTWYGENAVRKYPISETATAIDDNGKYLPNGLIIGMELSIPSTMTNVPEGLPEIITNCAPFISRAVVTPTDVRIDISAGESGVVATITTQIKDIPSSYEQKGFALASVPNEDPKVNGVGGYIVFGPAENFITALGEYVFSFSGGTSNSALALECIHIYPEILRSIRVDNHILTGDIYLEGGNGITLDIEGDDTIIIDLDTDSTEGIQSKADLITALTGIFGQPICKINGISPNDNGEFLLDVPANGCVRIEGQASGHGLTLSNPCAEPCCDKSSLENIMANIQTLNSRYGRLYSYLTETATMLNNLQNELSVLKMSLNYK